MYKTQPQINELNCKVKINSYDCEEGTRLLYVPRPAIADPVRVQSNQTAMHSCKTVQRKLTATHTNATITSPTEQQQIDSHKISV